MRILSVRLFNFPFRIVLVYSNYKIMMQLRIAAISDWQSWLKEMKVHYLDEWWGKLFESSI